ncbi:MAG TPA: hypothetical protein HA282_02255 [Nanoarchaeota archaeon]|nr:hypothetical protein [Nanoarchaeota archaeon]HIH66016.1 hypothetical protein [Nanoarchaeota archaeon]
MKCVIDTSPPSWLEKVGRLELLTQIYSEIYAPPLVLKQLESHYPTREFIKSNVKPIIFSEIELKKFNKLVDRWFRKLNLDDKGEVEVFVAYRYFLDVEEMLFANKGAERAFRELGRVRDIYMIYELAEERGIFTRKDSIEYLESLLNSNPPYRSKEVNILLRELANY